MCAHVHEQVVHPFWGSGTIVEVIQRSGKSLIEVQFQTGDKQKYSRQAAAKLQIEDESVILVGSRVTIDGHEGIVVETHAQKGFKISECAFTLNIHIKTIRF